MRRKVAITRVGVMVAPRKPDVGTKKISGKQETAAGDQDSSNSNTTTMMKNGIYRPDGGDGELVIFRKG